MSLQRYSAGPSAMKREGRSPTADTRQGGRGEVSVVLPMFNEEEVVLLMYRRLKTVAKQLVSAMHAVRIMVPRDACCIDAYRHRSRCRRILMLWVRQSHLMG